MLTFRQCCLPRKSDWSAEVLNRTLYRLLQHTTVLRVFHHSLQLCCICTMQGRLFMLLFSNNPHSIALKGSQLYKLDRV